MSAIRLRLKFGVKLAGDKPGMIFEFDDLNQIFLGIEPAKNHSEFLE